MQTRRNVLIGAACAAAMLPGAGIARAAPPALFSSRRITVTTRGALARGGRDVLMIPGLASGAGVWNGTIARVPGHRYHLVQVRGFAGLAPDGNKAGPLLAPLADDIARYIREMRLAAPAIVGHSMGGTLAMMLALRPANSIGRLLVVDMLPDGAAMVGGTSAGFGFLAGQLNGYFTKTKAGRQMLADMVRQSRGGRDSDPQVIAQALSELAQTDLGPQLTKIACPMEVIYALPTDTQLRAAQGDRYRRAYAPARRARIRPIGPSGHMIMLDQPAAFANALANFLRE
ncbi:alpha/beta fold hydrolase [Sphingobium subterraneum]|uniref:Pimeloyl-ACP methyl ester carboxylesterase n=1 Tax=Sphingobium subterraneum TaxID=627688 RepID=A0A841J1A0_9SPHN|nr:alpha/beta hydrolase [Sphingobium subterraneum]MBB6124713.1 pimeloyl-ACP methyl ester carboxylesterase [Sphingobium subterraneum]